MSEHVFDWNHVDDSDIVFKLEYEKTYVQFRQVSTKLQSRAFYRSSGYDVWQVADENELREFEASNFWHLVTDPSKVLKPVPGSKVMLHIPAVVLEEAGVQIGFMTMDLAHITQMGGTVEVLSNPEPDPVQEAIDYLNNVGHVGYVADAIQTLIKAVKEARKS